MWAFIIWLSGCDHVKGDCAPVQVCQLLDFQRPLKTSGVAVPAAKHLKIITQTTTALSVHFRWFLTRVPWPAKTSADISDWPEMTPQSMLMPELKTNKNRPFHLELAQSLCFLEDLEDLQLFLTWSKLLVNISQHIKLSWEWWSPSPSPSPSPSSPSSPTSLAPCSVCLRSWPEQTWRERGTARCKLLCSPRLDMAILIILLVMMAIMIITNLWSSVNMDATVSLPWDGRAHCVCYAQCQSSSL